MRWRSCFKKAKKSRGGSLGLTLIELMAATAIASIAFVYILGAVLNLATARESIEQATQASALISTVLENLSALNRDTLLDFQPDLTGLRGENQQITVECFYVAVGPHALPVPLKARSFTMPSPVENRVYAR